MLLLLKLDRAGHLGWVESLLRMSEIDPAGRQEAWEAGTGVIPSPSARYERLEEQLNDLTELHQNEMTNLKQELASMEEKVAYQSYERARDIQVQQPQEESGSGLVPPLPLNQDFHLPPSSPNSHH